MAESIDKTTYFTKYLFRSGLLCPTKLYYKAHNYPESREGEPFIRHAVYNKRMLKALVRSIYPDGIFIKADSVAEAAAQTKRLLTDEDAILFDPVFIHRQMRAKLPIIIKRGSQLTAMHIRTKAFSSRKHCLWNHKGEIHSRWRKHLIDFAYQLYILKQKYPDYSMLPLLVLPDKSGYAQTSGLPQLLRTRQRNKSASGIPAANQQLMVKLDVSEPISQIHSSSKFARKHFPKSSFAESAHFLRDIYLQKKKVDPDIGEKCKQCEFKLSASQKLAGQSGGFEECWSSERESLNGQANHVFDLIGPGTQKLIANDLFYQQQIDSSKLLSAEEIALRNGRISEKMRQSLQIHKAQGRQVPQEIMRPALSKELRRWQYPLHFLDFEAGNYAIPVRAGRPPYHLVVFQFSCHTLQEDGSWKHHQWIDEFDGEYSNYELVRQLMQVPDINAGTIVQYSNFERNALKIIRNELQEESKMIPDSHWLMQWLEELIERQDSSHPHPPYIADLSRQIKQYYYNSNMGSSLSIKDVLPSVMAQSTFLKQKYRRPYSSANFDQFIWWRSAEDNNVQNPYNLLEEGVEESVQRGTEAMTLYGKLIAGDLSKKEEQRCRRSLLRYCELDTLAMMMIYEHWNA